MAIRYLKKCNQWDLNLQLLQLTVLRIEKYRSCTFGVRFLAKNISESNTSFYLALIRVQQITMYNEVQGVHFLVPKCVWRSSVSHVRFASHILVQSFTSNLDQNFAFEILQVDQNYNWTRDQSISGRKESAQSGFPKLDPCVALLYVLQSYV